MLKRYHRMVGTTFRAVDACVIGGAWLLSYWLRFNVPIIPAWKGLPPFETYAALTPLVMILWAGVFSSLKVYKSQRMLRRTHEAQLLLKAHCIALLLFIAITYLFSEYRYSRGVMIYFSLIGGTFLVLFRLVLRNALRKIRRKGFNLRHVVTIGEGPSLDTVISRIDKFPELGLRVVGSVMKTKERSEFHGKPVLGTYDQISSIVETHRPDELIIALPRGDYASLDPILKKIQDETMNIHLIPDLHEYIALGCEVEDFDGLPIVNINDSPLDGWGHIGKRITDFILSFIALVLISPLLLLISLAVKLTSRGPIFYGQERMGLDGETFYMYKFRSMKTDAESESGAVWARENDDRRTPIGAFLRSTSLDELPQLWNVLKGEMSLVGPRPERPVFVKQFRGEIPNYMLRHKVKAGITGWAQVNGWRGNTSLDRRIEFDLYYIRNWSYFLDIKILFLTVWKGFIHKNAY